MYVNLEKFELTDSEIQGNGLFALQRIEKNEVIVNWHQKALSKEEAKKTRWQAYL